MVSILSLMAEELQRLKEAMPLQTIPSFVIASTLVVLLVLYYLFLRTQRHRLPPSPWKLPIIGNLHQLGTMPHLSLHRLSNMFGPIIHLQLGEISTVVVSSATLAKEVMKTHDLVLANRPQLYAAKYLLYDCTDIGFAPFGAYFKNLRKICALELLSPKRVQSYSYIREEEAERLVRRIADSSYPSTTNLSKMLWFYGNDVVCRAAYGKNFSIGGQFDQHGFHQLLEEFQILLGGFSLGDYFPSMEWIAILTGMKSRLVKAHRGFDQFLNEVIEEHRSANKIKDEGTKDLVDVLLDLQKSGSYVPLTMDNIKAVILDMFAGGTDTTYITLDWGMTELMLNPRVREKAQLEVRSIVGERRVTESDLIQLHYLKAVIKEILRMHPAAPLLAPRESSGDITIDEYNFPAKTRFIVNAWAISRDPNTWENPDKFEPERFIDSCIDFKGNDFNYIPFGAGRRICPGWTFGMASVELALARLLHSFDFELPPGTKPSDLDLSETFGLTMQRTSNLNVVAKPHFPLKY